MGETNIYFEKTYQKTYFLFLNEKIYNLNICYPLNIVFELGISVYNHANDINGLVMHNKAINKWGKQKSILKKL